MYKIEIKPKGFDALKKKFRVSSVQLAATYRAALVEASLFTLEELKRNTPVDTGNLKESMGIEYDPLEVKSIVGPDMKKAPYAGWVEFGHHLRNGTFLPGQYYVRRTTRNVRAKVVQMFSDALKRIFE